MTLAIGDAVTGSADGRLLFVLNGELSDADGLEFHNGRLYVPDGTGAGSGSEPNKTGAGWGGLNVRGPLSYFGGGTQDLLKISAQAAGNGAVVLAINAAATDYEPLNLRGETITGQYRIPDPGNPSGPSGMSLPGFRLNTSGNFEVMNDLQVDGDASCDHLQPAVIDLGPQDGYYIGSAHGHRFNSSDDSENHVTFEDDGVVRLHKYAGTGTRYLGVNSSGRVVVI